MDVYIILFKKIVIDEKEESPIHNENCHSDSESSDEDMDVNINYTKT